MRLRPIALAFADRPPEDRHLGYVLEVRQDRGEAQSLRGPGLPRNGLSHAIHQLKLISFGIFESRYCWPPMKYIVFTLKSLSSVRRIIAGLNPAGCWENECLVAPLLLLRLTLAYYPLFAFQSIQRFSFVARTHPQNLRQDTSGRLRGPKIVLFKL